MPAPCLAAVIATYRRPAELARCLASLRAAPEVRHIVVADNASDPATAAVVAAHGPGAQRLALERNRGVGGGLRAAMEQARESAGSALTHYLILDDDAELGPGAVSGLLAAADAAQAEIACPIITDGNSRLGWFPRLRDAGAWAAVRRARTPAEYLSAAGPAPMPFSWSTFVCLLASAAAVHAVGWPREDFWVRGEDLEYSLRLTAGHRSAFVPTVEVKHLPPPAVSTTAERWKGLAMLQNSAYLATRQPHTRELARHLPGNVVRFLISSDGGAATLPLIARAVWNGLVRGRPAGVAGADYFRLRAGM